MKTVDNVEKNKKKGSKKLLLIIPIVIVVVLILAFIFGEKVPKVDETDGIKMTADEIAEKFLNDKSGMDKEFHNKVYEVTGNVEDSNGQYSMTLSTESGEYEIYFDVDKEKSNKIPKLDKGDTVTMKGLYNRVLTDRIDFKDALYIASEKATEPPTEVETKSNEDVDRGVVERILIESMAQGFDENCFNVEYNEEVDSYVISLWQENIVSSVLLAKEDEDLKAEWDAMVENLKTSTNQFLEAARTFDDNANITFNLLNDSNTDNVLLMIHNGEVMYDELNQ
ncbi:MAG: OB-fold protein [Oscillospiraceae bacterium]